MSEEKIKKKRKKTKKKSTSNLKIPIYKRWWFIFACGIIVGVLFSPSGNSENEKTIQSSEAKKEVKETKKVSAVNSTSSEIRLSSSKEEKTTDTTNKKDEVKTKHNDLNFSEISIIDIETTVKNNELTLKFRWRNDSLEGKKSFIQAGVLIDVLQGDDILEEKDNLFGSIGGNVSYQAKKGIETPITAKYKLKNDENIKINFNTNNEYDEKKTIEVKFK